MDLVLAENLYKSVSDTIVGGARKVYRGVYNFDGGICNFNGGIYNFDGGVCNFDRAFVKVSNGNKDTFIRTKRIVFLKEER